MRDLSAAYRAPASLRWLWLAYRAAALFGAPLWPVLTARWARAFPWPAENIQAVTGYVTPHPDALLRAFLAAQYAYSAAYGGPPPCARVWGDLRRVREHLVLHPNDDVRLDLILRAVLP